MAPSPVWNYFEKIGDGTSVKCIRCKKVYKFNKSTTSLSNHLKIQHKIEFKKQKEKEIVSDGEGEGDTPRAECVNTFSGPLDRTFRSINAYSADGHKHETMLDALMFMIVKDNMPLRTPQKEGFRLFCKKLQPLYKPPSPITITEGLTKKYENLSAKIKNEMLQADQVCLTTDLWTHKYTMQSYLGITAHYLVDFDIKSVELGAYPMDERKTIDNIRCVLREICSSWGLTDEKISAIVSDGGANIKGAIRREFGDYKHISCFAHSINNIGQKVIELNVQNIAPPPVLETSIDEDLLDTEDLSQNLEHLPLRNLIRKVKAIVRFFKQSEVASKLFKTIQKQGGSKEYLKLIQEVPTRWNSCYEMLDRFISLADHVGRVLLQIQIEKSSKRKPPEMPTSSEIEILTEIRDVLKPLWFITQEVSSEKNVSVSKCIPLIAGLKTQLNTLNPITALGKKTKEKLDFEICDKFESIEAVRVFAAATLLDPRFKKLGFRNIRMASSVISHLGDLVKAEINTIANDIEDVIVDDTEAADPEDIWYFLDNSVSSSRMPYLEEDKSIPSQLRQYFRSPTINRKTNPSPLKAWCVIQNEYPYVWKVAKKMLPIMATSVPSERLFSHAGIIANQLRTRLSPNHLNMLVFLHSVDQDIWFNN